MQSKRDVIQASLVAELKEILSPLPTELEEKQKRIDEILKKLEEKEKKLGEIEKAEELQKALIEEIEKSPFWQDSKRMVNEIKLSAAYTAEINFDENNKLKYKKISIRTGAKQDRHVTPVAIVNKIISNSLQSGENAGMILDSLASKIEILKTNFTDTDNDDIQRIFSYFRHPNFQNASGISMMIKIISHLYNEKSLLAFNDEYNHVPYVNERYLIPNAGATTLVHQNEGTFIKELCKIIGEFACNVPDEKDINADKAYEAAGYAVYAMFDYLPLSEKTKGSGKKPFNEDKNRYKGEGKERLYKLAANHLHCVYEAYPEMESCKAKLFEIFLRYVSNGVKLENLFMIFNKESKKELLRDIFSSNNPRDVERFINTGFSKQYGMQDQLFYEELREGVERHLINYNSDYLFEIHPEYKLPETPVLKNRNISFECYFNELARLYYVDNGTFEKFFDKILPDVDESFFEDKYKNAVVEHIKIYLEEYQDKKMEKLLGSLKIDSQSFHEPIIDFVKNNDHASVSMNKIIAYSIQGAYSNCIEAKKISDSDITDDVLRNIREMTKEYRDKQKTRKVLTYKEKTGLSSNSSDNDSGTYKDNTSSNSSNDPDYSISRSESSDSIDTNISNNIKTPENVIQKGKNIVIDTPYNPKHSALTSTTHATSTMSISSTVSSRKKEDRSKNPDDLSKLPTHTSTTQIVSTMGISPSVLLEKDKQPEQTTSKITHSKKQTENVEGGDLKNLQTNTSKNDNKKESNESKSYTPSKK